MGSGSTAKSVSGSFRDKHNQVFEQDGAILRGISIEAEQNWIALSEEPFFRQLLEEGYVVKTELRKQGISGWPATMHHARVPTISYPYEWSFGMLKSAALFHLHLLERCLENGWMLKDASAYNVQWNGAKPVFIDIPSFERYDEGAPWAAYRQFCMMFLYPLMLSAYRGIDFRPLLRSSLDGITPSAARKMLGGSAAYKPGVLSHVFLHATLERRAELKDAAEARSVTENSGRSVRNRNVARHTKRMLLGTIDSLRRIVRKLELPEVRTSWGNYAQEHSYSDGSFEAKKAFVQRHCSTRRRTCVWDIGCNTGTFSRLAAAHSDQVIAIDGDGLAIERLYRALKAEQNTRILPLVANLTNPSPNQGWLGTERVSLEERSKPELILCLALIHHLVLTANVPLISVIQWLRSFNCDVVLEYVDLEDPMCQMLLRNRGGSHHSLTDHELRNSLQGKFTVVDSEDLKGGLRTIFLLSPI
ncbi:hypothetical protein [Rhizobium ruizarguesonis]